MWRRFMQLGRPGLDPAAANGQSKRSDFQIQLQVCPDRRRRRGRWTWGRKTVPSSNGRERVDLVCAMERLKHCVSSVAIFGGAVGGVRRTTSVSQAVGQSVSQSMPRLECGGAVTSTGLWMRDKVFGEIWMQFRGGKRVGGRRTTASCRSARGCCPLLRGGQVDSCCLLL